MPSRQPAPGRSEDADRGDSRGDGRAGEGGEGASPRAVGGRAGDDPPGGGRRLRRPGRPLGRRESSGDERSALCHGCVSRGGDSDTA